MTLYGLPGDDKQTEIGHIHQPPRIEKARRDAPGEHLHVPFVDVIGMSDSSSSDYEKLDFGLVRQYWTASRRQNSGMPSTGACYRTRLVGDRSGELLHSVKKRNGGCLFHA